jgi:ApeA-like protein/HEPN superfamily Apea-like protein
VAPSHPRALRGWPAVRHQVTRPHLELFGSLRETSGPATFEAYRLHREPIVLGLLEDGVRITVVDAYRTRSKSLLFAGAFREVYRSHLAFRGINTENPDALRFEKALLRLSHLDDWVTLTGFAQAMEFSPENRLTRYEGTYSWPPEVEARTSEGTITVTYTFHPEVPGAGDRISAHQKSWLRFEPPQPVSFKECVSRFVHRMRQLVSLATGRANHVLQLDLHPVPLEPGRVQASKSIEAIFTEHGRTRRAKRLQVEDMLFTLSDVQTKFSELVPAFFEASERYRAALNAFLAVFYDVRMLGEQRFLDLARAVESFHREDHRGQPDPTVGAHAVRIEAILTSTPAEYRSWLEHALRFSNTPSFRQQLRDLLKETAPLIGPLVKPNRKVLIHKVHETRNWLTHLDRDGAPPEPDLVDLFQLGETLGFLLQAVLLRRLGCSEAETLMMLQRNERFQVAVARARKTS